MKLSYFGSSALGALLALGALSQTQTVAKADTGSTVSIAAGAAAIVGALLYDSNRQPYYVRNNRHVYVTQSEANYYRGQHHGGQYHGGQRNVYVAQPMSQSRYYGNPHGNDRGNGRGQGQHGDHGHNHR